uniref:Zinc finger protein 395a n=1 Tax=Labrus bergylta TaxID=56723 RepID=A0A3Q3GBS1_9LABR
MLPKTRLGKRSPFGALVSSACPAAGTHAGQETGETSIAMATVGGEHPISRRSPEEVDMDALMAAMVLSSLSCTKSTNQWPNQIITTAPPMDCGGGDLSDGGSSGYLSIGHSNGSPAPSPPIADPAGLEQVLFDEPAPRKRRNSVKSAYRCLWPSCGKVLTSVVGIKRHIRTTHLCRGGEHERCSRSEEDFYYTEINQWDQQPQQQQSPPLPLHCSPAPASPTSSSSSPPSPPPSSPQSPPSPVCSALSRSAPSASGSIWQVKSEHSYQVGRGLSSTSYSDEVHRSLTDLSVSLRRIRGEAKKCRKVYGIEHRDQWCTSCRWKKACQRFLD